MYGYFWSSLVCSVSTSSFPYIHSVQAAPRVVRQPTYIHILNVIISMKRGQNIFEDLVARNIWVVIKRPIIISWPLVVAHASIQHILLISFVVIFVLNSH
jgi:hypothetical protein